MEKNDRIEELVQKFNIGEISLEEYHQLLNWYNSFNDDETTILHIEDLKLNQIKKRMFNRIARKTILLNKSNNYEKYEHSNKMKNIFKWIISTAAAIVILMGSIIWVKSIQRTEKHYNEESEIVDVIKPGSNKAKIILPNGKELELQTESGGIEIGKNIKYASGLNILLSSELELLKNDQPISIRTPKGGIYHIKLADGTEVLLNAGSQLTYSKGFNNGDARSVELEGEAYFKVAKKTDKNGNRIPFIIKTQRQEIEVLGTEFNVMDYKQFSYAHTTLVEGKVRLKSKNKNFPLKPNQQWILTHNNFSVRTVNPESFTAWSSGKFDFNNKSLQNILDEISLWYNIDVKYLSQIPDVELTGQAYRNSSFNLILRLLQVAKVDYSIDLTKNQLIIK